MLSITKQVEAGPWGLALKAWRRVGSMELRQAECLRTAEDHARAGRWKSQGGREQRWNPGHTAEWFAGGRSNQAGQGWA